MSALQIIDFMLYVSDNFLAHPKTLPCTYNMNSVRVANSLRHVLASSYKVVVAKEIYFSNFFAHKKLRKIASKSH